MRRQRVWSFVVSSGFVVVAVTACVGGGGSLPEPIGSEGTTASGSGDQTKNSVDAPSPSSGSNGSGSSKNPSQPGSSDCTPGASCDCGSTQLVGTVKCTDAGEQCSCALRGDAG